MSNPLFRHLSLRGSEIMVMQLQGYTQEVERGRSLESIAKANSIRFAYLKTTMKNLKLFTSTINAIRTANLPKAHLSVLTRFTAIQKEDLTVTAIAKTMRHDTSIDLALVEAEVEMEKNLVDIAEYYLKNFGLWQPTTSTVFANGISDANRRRQRRQSHL